MPTPKQQRRSSARIAWRHPSTAAPRRSCWPTGSRPSCWSSWSTLGSRRRASRARSPAHAGSKSPVCALPRLAGGCSRSFDGPDPPCPAKQSSLCALLSGRWKRRGEGELPRRRCALDGSDRTGPTLVRGPIPIGVWHDFVVLERNTAVLEIKPSPYLPNKLLIGRQRKGTQSQLDL